MPDVGLAGYRTQTKRSLKMAFNITADTWDAIGIPTVNYDDNNNFNVFPMARIVAKDTTGKVLAQTSLVLSVSDEISCNAGSPPTRAMWNSTDTKPALTVMARITGAWLLSKLQKFAGSPVQLLRLPQRPRRKRGLPVEDGNKFEHSLKQLGKKVEIRGYASLLVSLAFCTWPESEEIQRT